MIIHAKEIVLRPASPAQFKQVMVKPEDPGETMVQVTMTKQQAALLRIIVGETPCSTWGRDDSWRLYNALKPFEDHQVASDYNRLVSRTRHHVGSPYVGWD